MNIESNFVALELRNMFIFMAVEEKMEVECESIQFMFPFFFKILLYLVL